ncbi:uncharacterized protein DUF1311 [Mucilaginibacter yixingensis]|uniref:Uncharacterized protein DUF1311 n=1 Tax=Mucilaginibacter yixingensis TaxID=1295612 RepID=A0A2T5JEE1_9SPHI|nr:lysozyme inhibitor LprI family protein [Mucilaginibacter yixingensis]PTR00801.1 uncharacterized protein DUF1311 [Mucilaginibacter yixingensis]
MKKFLILLCLIMFVKVAFCQNDGPKQVTPQMLQTIKANIEKEVTVLKQRKGKDKNADELAFMADTFRIEQTFRKTSAIDYSTAGMREGTNVRREGYDKLLNTYYNKLLKLLKPADKAILINAQRSWITYRDNEAKLIYKLSEDEYSGGGTIQQLISAGDYADLTVQRAIAIFQYYDSVINK